MCGILGIASKSNVTEKLLSGLSELEYRGYDSSGIAVIDKEIRCCKIKGTVKKLQQTVDRSIVKGSIGIAHNRWATHGNPSTINAHPHITDKVAVVHNGIIENVSELRSLLKEQYNISYQTDTDTEVITLLITEYLNEEFSALESVWKTIKLLKGSFTFASLIRDEQAIIAVRKGSPLLIGYGENGDIILSSDQRALSLFATNVIFLEDDDVVYLRNDEFLIYDKNNVLIKRDNAPISGHQPPPNKGTYCNFMLKEIFDQTYTLLDTVKNFYKNKTVPKIDKEVIIVACGSSYFAALIAKYWLKSIRDINVQLEIASEFIYQGYGSLTTILFISQSGETADILVGLKDAKLRQNYTIGLTNTRGSSLARLADEVFYTEAGSEIGVASTKTFTSQLIALQCLARKDDNVANYLDNVKLISEHIKAFLNKHDEVQEAVDIISRARNVMYIGRGTSYGLAMEGALKLKELAYIPAEGIAAGELKHGTLALIDERVITIVIIPYNGLFYKTFSNIQEIVARGGQVIALSDEQGKKLLSSICKLVITMPTIDDFFSPILYAIPIQLIAYYTAAKFGYDVDKPRNLAKSVTVE